MKTAPLPATNLSHCIAACYARLLNEPRWLQEFRAQAYQHWQTLPPPTRRDEDYRYTNIKPLLAAKLTPVTATDKITTSDYAALLHPDEHHLLFNNGMSTTTTPALPDGVRCLSLRQAIANGLVSAATLRLQVSNDYLQLMNDICFYDGVYLHVAAGVTLDRPLHLIFVNSEQATQGAMFNRNIIVLDDNAAAQVIESHVGLTTASYLSVTRTSIDIGKNATCAYVKFQHEGEAAYHGSTSECQQQQNSRFSLVDISYGARLARLGSHIEQQAAAAACDFRALYIGKGQQLLDNYSQIKHFAVEGKTSQRVRGIVSEHAQGIFTGNISVPRQAQRTDASQLTKNLLLGKDCAVYIKPQLQIEADDVQCSHGATSSRIADRDLFYLASRGIGLDNALRLLCRAHVEELAQDLPIANSQRFFNIALENI